MRLLLSAAKRGAVLAPLLLCLMLSWLLLPLPAQAQGGIAMSGTFYHQNFEIPQGVELSAPSIYVVVFNQGDEEFGVRMSSETPLGVNISFSEDDFSLVPGGQKQVYVTVKVSEDAIPGDYELLICAQRLSAETEGAVGISTSVAQKAKLKVLGESAWVEVKVLSPTSEPVVAQVRLFKLIEGRENEFAMSTSGTLEAKVSPGHYIVRAYVASEMLAEESFAIAADESKSITLTVRTIYFGGVGVVPNYYTETGELAFAQVVYTLHNLYQPMNDVEVILKVTEDGVPSEEISVLSLGTLDVGDIGGSYNYIPQGGWQDGDYGFRLELYVGGKLYTTTLEHKLSTGLAPTPINWPLIGGIIAAVAVIGGVVYLVVRRRRA